MAVNNQIGSIMAKYVIGEEPAIFFDEDRRRFSLRTYIGGDVYRNIFDDAARCGSTVYRDSIDRFISALLNSEEVIIKYASRIYNDLEILAGERIRLYTTDAELDLLKIRSRCYVCTKGIFEGETITLKNDSLDFTHKNVVFDVRSVAFLVPSSTYIALDYRYLKSYRSDVVSDISDLFREVFIAFQNNQLEAEFLNLLKMCSDFGVSIWTLMGIIDCLQIKYDLSVGI